MRVMCIHPRDDYNIGDLMTFYGARYLLRKAFGEVEYCQFDTRRAEREFETYVPEFNWGGNVDMILLAGSPWLGANPDDMKLQWLVQAKQRWPSAKTVALGIGAFYRHSSIVARDYSKPGGEGGEEMGVADCFRDFSLVVVRDSFAEGFLVSSGVPCMFYYDTSIFSFQQLWPGKQDRSKDVLIFADPMKADAWDHMPAFVWERYVDYQVRWATRRKAEVYAISSGDQATAQKNLLPSHMVNDLEWMALQLARARHILTPRVHQAILASIMGCPSVGLMPLDSRFLTAMNVGVRLEQPVIQFTENQWKDGRLLGIVDRRERYLFSQDGYRHLPFSRKKLASGQLERPLVAALRGVFQ